MCALIRQQQMQAALDLHWRGPAHDAAALREGWVLSECHGSRHGALQVQCVDAAAALQTAGSLPFAVPMLDSDLDAWALVRGGVEPHHFAARALLACFNPMELGCIAWAATASSFASVSQAV